MTDILGFLTLIDKELLINFKVFCSTFFYLCLKYNIIQTINKKNP